MNDTEPDDNSKSNGEEWTTNPIPEQSDSLSYTGAPDLSHWEVVTVHRAGSNRYRVCLKHRTRTDGDSVLVKATMTAEQRDAQTKRNNLWETIYSEPINVARNWYDHIERHVHTGAIRAYRVGGFNPNDRDE